MSIQTIASGDSGATSLSKINANFAEMTSAWLDWTPTFYNFTKGSATIKAKCIVMGKTVHFYLIVTLAADSSITGSRVLFSLPSNAVNVPSSGDLVVGTCYIQDNGTASYIATVSVSAIDSTKAEILVPVTGGTYLSLQYISATVPMTWTTNDQFSCRGTYEAA